MSLHEVTEQQVIKALHDVPAERLGEVLVFLQTLESRTLSAGDEKRTLTASDLAASGLVGMWKDRTDIDSSQEFARQLRARAERRDPVR